MSSTVRKTRRETCCTPFGPETTQSHIWRRRRLVPAVVFLFESSMTKKKNRAGTPPPDPASSLPVEAEVDYAAPQTVVDESVAGLVWVADGSWGSEGVTYDSCSPSALCTAARTNFLKVVGTTCWPRASWLYFSGRRPKPTSEKFAKIGHQPRCQLVTSSIGLVSYFRELRGCWF